MRKWFRNLWISLLSGTAVLASCGVRPSAKLYGPPPVDTINEQQPSRRQALQQRLDSIRDIIVQRENAKIYGSPEVIQSYREKTNRLKAEADSLSRELEALEYPEAQPKIDPIKDKEAVPLYGVQRPRIME